ncbi:hypothetical protein BLNAU_24595 [Blattamonas nauphoetae]|uniref:Uncharacterized protein n=1 Tax=Blattamonas nauphoetae TaxID=2049346 RepID=A0ABQ9WR40_9EUKA|nr:hypothetical protein BLNAU_24595 [Blattamonas nauphoetae]
MGSRQPPNGPPTQVPWTTQDTAQSWCKEAAAPRWVPTSGKRNWCGQTQRPLQGRHFSIRRLTLTTMPMLRSGCQEDR